MVNKGSDALFCGKIFFYKKVLSDDELSFYTMKGLPSASLSSY